MFFGDNLVNLVTGLGTDKDKVQAGQFNLRVLTRFELENLYQHNWMGGQIVDCPADDSTREWRQWSGGARQRAAMEKAERVLKVRERVNHALKMARLYGGSAILIGDGSADPSQELDYDRIKKNGIRFLHSLSMYEIWAAYINRNPLHPFFGEPEYYTLSAPLAGPNALPAGRVESGLTLQIHPSRVIRFIGVPRLETTLTWDGWGYSVLNRCYDPIRNATAAMQNMAAMTYEAKLDVIKIPGLTQNVLSDDYAARLIARFSLANQSKSVNNALVLDAEEEWDQKQIGFANFPEVLRTFLEIVAGAADIPATRMLGTSAKGLNATGEGDARNYLDVITSRQNIDLRPRLERLDYVIARHAGVDPMDVEYKWNPLWRMRENERAAIEMQNAQADQIMATMGAMPPSALRTAIQNRLIANDTYPGLADALDAAGSEAPAPLIDPATVRGREIGTPSSSARVTNT